MMSKIFHIAFCFPVFFLISCRSDESMRGKFVKLSNFQSIEKHFRSVKEVDCGESVGFEVVLNKAEYDQVVSKIEILKAANWIRGGITYGSIDVGWSTKDDVHYFRKELKSGTEVVAISEKNMKLWYIRNPS